MEKKTCSHKDRRQRLTDRLKTYLIGLKQYKGPESAFSLVQMRSNPLTLMELHQHEICDSTKSSPECISNNTLQGLLLLSYADHRQQNKWPGVQIWWSIYTYRPHSVLLVRVCRCLSREWCISCMHLSWILHMLGILPLP